VFEESITTETDQSEFTEKKWVYVNDNNSQNYSSQVVIDSTPLSNAGGYVNWSEGYILMPLVVEATAAQGLGGADVPNMMGFKNGYWNMINSMSVEFNNQTIVQQTPFLNVFRSFKAHTSFSESDVINHGNEIGYALDTASSWGYSTGNSLSGKGIFNNEYAPPTEGQALSTNWDLGSHNEGLRKRMENTNKFSSGKSKTDVVTDATRGLLYQSRCVSKSATSVVWIDVAIPQYTYKTFGKHLIHYPSLRDDYKVSIKYPSRSKNVGKVKVVSPEYRELLMDLLERGVLSDRMYDKLVDEEKQHFNEAVKASGLMETIKLKPINEDTKDLVERFKVLRGQFIAGNNAPTLIKELRSVILHFMEKGQIQKQDGYDLLKELSAV